MSQRRRPPGSSGRIGTASIILIAANDLPANNLQELVALAKAKPGSLQYASWGSGSTGHFCGELLNLKTRATLSHIPYKSVAQIQNDILGGHIKLGWVDMASGTPMVKSGRVKALATCPSRSPSLPDVPSYEEEGIDFGGKRTGELGWALYAPAGTPKPIVDKLAGALRATVEIPEVKARLLSMGIRADFLAGDEFSEVTAKAIDIWKQVATEAKITND